MNRSRMMATAAFALVVTATAFAYINGPVVYTGQGLTADAFGNYDLNSEICKVENGAEVDGAYLLWVLTATAAPHADITFNATAAPTLPDAGVHQMFRQGNTTSGAFKYVSAWHDPSDLIGNVQSTYDGTLKKNTQLVISHGCRPKCADAGIAIDLDRFAPSGGNKQADVTVTFAIGPVTLNWGDGATQVVQSGVLVTHYYVQSPIGFIVNITATSAAGCSESIPYEIDGLQLEH
jgi:hypothetical protein